MVNKMDGQLLHTN